MAYGYRGWRRQWGDERRCGGALLWQLNDCWPGISWAIVDYFLRPKPAYYAVARVLKPLAIGVCREHHDWSVVHAQPPKTSKYDLWIVSSHGHEVIGRVELKFISVNTGIEVCDPIIKDDISIAPNGTTNIIVDGIIDHTTHPEPHVLSARLWVDDSIIARDVDWPQPLKYLDFSDRGLEVKEVKSPAASSCKDNNYELTVSAKKPLKSLVFEQRDDVVFSDNALDVVPGDVQVIQVTGLKEGDKPLTWNFIGW